MTSLTPNQLPTSTNSRTLRVRNRLKRIREFVINRDGSICCYCDKVLVPETLTMEHLIPDSKQGTFNSTNLTVACAPCNNRRGNQPFFDYCQQFAFSEEKLNKYLLLCLNNLKIKILNLAKERCLITDMARPHDLIITACHLLQEDETWRSNYYWLDISQISFTNYEQEYPFDIRFDQLSERKRIKFCFEQLIRIIEAEHE